MRRLDTRPAIIGSVAFVCILLLGVLALHLAVSEPPQALPTGKEESLNSPQALRMGKAESLDYELYELRADGQKTLLSKGTREYTPQDVEVQTRSFLTNKEIPVANGFSVGVSIFPNNLKGFGLWLRDRGTSTGLIAQGGHSWDWFDYWGGGDLYRKLQGAGLIRVRFIADDSSVEDIAAIEVIEDITLRVTDTDTHHLVLKKGSILRFTPFEPRER